MKTSMVIRKERDAVIVSFSRPVMIASWASVNGGLRRADHIVNHHVDCGDARFAADPERWLRERADLLNLKGKAIMMATAVDMDSLIRVSYSNDSKKVACLATVGCSNALAAGDIASFQDGPATSLHTINLILLVDPGLTEEGMIEAVQIATEGRVRALYEAGVLSSQSGVAATGTGTDCMAIAALGLPESRYCGKHTKLGELVGRASYTAVKKGIAAGQAAAGN